MARCPYDAKHANVALFAGKKRVCVILSNVNTCAKVSADFIEVKICQICEILLLDTSTQ